LKTILEINNIIYVLFQTELGRNDICFYYFDVCTGQKGIGFKSVFRVTDRPEIHSNGYHICFDVHSGPMGYILPHWIEDDEAHNK